MLYIGLLGAWLLEQIHWAERSEMRKVPRSLKVQLH